MHLLREELSYQVSSATLLDALAWFKGQEGPRRSDAGVAGGVRDTEKEAPVPAPPHAHSAGAR